MDEKITIVKAVTINGTYGLYEALGKKKYKYNKKLFKKSNRYKTW